MNERRKGLLTVTLLLLVLVAFFGKILFTDKIIRAPDIMNEYYWTALRLAKQSFLDVFRIPLTAQWDIFSNGGNTLEGGEAGTSFLVLQRLIYQIFPLPAAVAWFMVIHYFIGGWGVYVYCRTIGVSRPAAFFGGLIFALAPENASLINAGHVLKVATIAYAPWAFVAFEKGFQSRRLIWFLTTGVVLAYQFFNTHWQIAYYTCLAIGVYGILRSIGILRAERQLAARPLLRLLGLNLATMCFFLSTVAISLLPLANWSTDTNRGVQSGANLGKGGLAREEAMLWSLPPEELAAFVIPGMFGLSRQEAGPNPTTIDAYYWGRMIFTQTTSYLGLLPWLLLPLPLIFRRDKHTWLAVTAVFLAILFSMGKYTPFYNFLFDHFPGINRFRVPKMMMFVAVMGLAVLAARGLDVLRDERVRESRAFRGYLYGLGAVPLVLGGLLAVEYLGRERLIRTFIEMLARPTNYEQGPYLVGERWRNLMTETGLAAILAALCAIPIVLLRKRWLAPGLATVLLIALYLGDVARIDGKFMFLVAPPTRTMDVKTPVIKFLEKESKEYRVLPLGTDPNYYSNHRIPVLFTPLPVQQVRWQNTLDNLTWDSAIPDMLNVKYLVYPTAQYEQDKGALGAKYEPVFTAPDGSEVVLQNRSVLPKAWLVPAVLLLSEPQQAFAALRNPAFDPRRLATVETPPPLPLAGPNQPVGPPGEATVTRYEGERIDVTARADENVLLVLGEKFYRGWQATVDGRRTEIYPVNQVLRGVYLSPGRHEVEFRFDPLPFKVGKYLTLASLALFAVLLGREARLRKRMGREA